MYEQKEYMEEYLKFKDVIANMKKWGVAKNMKNVGPSFISDSNMKRSQKEKYYF